MTQRKTKPKAQKVVADTIRFEAPVEIFGEGKWVERRRKIKLKVQDQILNWPSDDYEGLCTFLATLVPRWNLDDCETGEPLACPEDDSMIFGELDQEEEFPWVMELLNPQKASSRRRIEID